jgi:hypothetical protein
LYWAVSEADVGQAGSFSAVFALSEVFRVDPLQHSEVFVYLQAFPEKLVHLHAFRDLQGALVAIVIVALNEGAFVGETWEFVVGLNSIHGYSVFVELEGDFLDTFEVVFGEVAQVKIVARVVGCVKRFCTFLSPDFGV